MQLRLQTSLISQMRHRTWPRNPDLAFRVGLEYVRAAVDGRDPARWAQAALRPRRKVISHR